MTDNSIGRKIRTTLSRSLDYVVDSYYGIRTDGYVLPHELGYEGTDYHPYLAVSWIGLFQIFKNVQPGPCDAFLDVGCGKGRALVAALRLPFAKVIGIDRSKEMIESASDNLLRYESRRTSQRKRAEIFCIDATEFDIPIDVTWILMHCPFGEKTTQEFFKKLAQVSPPGTARNIIAINPIFMSWIGDYFSVSLEKSWGGGWYNIYRIQKK